MLNGYLRILEPMWNSVRLDQGTREFRKQFRAFRPEFGHLFAAVWCSSEIENGGFHQFFYNSTGILAPEAVDGFGAIGLKGCARPLCRAMRFFGESYPRDRARRLKRLPKRSGESRKEWDPFFDLDEAFYTAFDEELIDEYALKIWELS
jgi:hypothetical protein